MMTNELLPCPFCDSEYTQVRWIGFKDKSNGAFEPGFRGECTECFALTRAFNDEAEAIAAWNTRTGRTCKAEPLHDANFAGGWAGWKCSACGELINKADNYCANCGRKVVE